MKYEQLGNFIHIPEVNIKPLENRSDVKFNYYLSSRVNGKHIDLDITTKLFDEDQMYIRKACYRVRLGEIENCVKYNLIDHMRYLGISDEDIPVSLIKTGITSHAIDCSNSNAY